ncbi:MAG: thioredoxin family protein [Planctomycetota bacterium]
MAATPSTMSPLGTAAPDFKLSDPQGKMIALSDFAGARALLVMFICNHCPFVKHIAHGLVDLGNVYQSKGVAVVAINSNDVEKHPDDRPLMMAEEVVSRGYTFPYLFDETQETAKAYRAACTPDFFVYDQDRKLVYRGQLDDSRPSNDMPVTGADLRAALDAVIEGRPVNEDQKPSIGCNIKWKPGNEPDYFSS